MLSYEGVIITPINIFKNTYNENQNIYSYEVRIELAPIDLPDRWETLNMKHILKRVLHDFFEYF